MYRRSVYWMIVCMIYVESISYGVSDRVPVLIPRISPLHHSRIKFTLAFKAFSKAWFPGDMGIGDPAGVCIPVLAWEVGHDPWPPLAMWSGSILLAPILSLSCQEIYRFCWKWSHWPLINTASGISRIISPVGSRFWEYSLWVVRRCMIGLYDLKTSRERYWVH